MVDVTRRSFPFPSATGNDRGSTTPHATLLPDRQPWLPPPAPSPDPPLRYKKSPTVEERSPPPPHTSHCPCSLLLFPIFLPRHRNHGRHRRGSSPSIEATPGRTESTQNSAVSYSSSSSEESSREAAGRRRGPFFSVHGRRSAARFSASPGPTTPPGHFPEPPPSIHVVHAVSRAPR